MLLNGSEADALPSAAAPTALGAQAARIEHGRCADSGPSCVGRRSERHNPLQKLTLSNSLQFLAVSKAWLRNHHAARTSRK